MFPDRPGGRFRLRSGPLRADAKKPAKLEGTWLGTAAEDYGKKMPKNKIGGFKLVFTADEFTAFDGKTLIMKGTYTTGGQRPNSIDLKSKSGRHAGETLPGLFEVDGDKLRICFVTPGTERPMKLKSTLENAAFLLECKRKKP